MRKFCLQLLALIVLLMLNTTQIYSGETVTGSIVPTTKVLATAASCFYPTKIKVATTFALFMLYLMSNKMLNWSIERGSRLLALFSLLCGANPSKNNDDYSRGKNYLYKAVSWRRLPIARLLLARGAILSKDDKSELIEKAAHHYYSNDETVRFLLDGTENLKELLWSYGLNSDLLEWIIKKDPQRKSEIIEKIYLSKEWIESALLDFASRNRLEAFTEMLSWGANPKARDRDGKTALQIASEKNHPLIIDRLLKTEEFGPIEMFEAFIVFLRKFNGRNEDIQAFTKNGFELNMRDHSGLPVLQYAIELNKPDVVDSLIKLGAKVDYVDREGRTPLIYSIYKKLYDVAKVLIARGCPIDAQDNFGRTALIEAISLEDSYRRKKAQDPSRLITYTPYHYHPESLVHDIVEKGHADITKRTLDGKTALTFAYRSGNTNIFRYLASKVAKNMYDQNTEKCPCCLESPKEVGLAHCTVLPCCTKFICTSDFSSVVNTKKLGANLRGESVQFSQCPLCRANFF